MFGDAELDDDDLYSMEHDNPTGKHHTDLLRTTGELHTPLGSIGVLMNTLVHWMCNFSTKISGVAHRGIIQLTCPSMAVQKL